MPMLTYFELEAMPTLSVGQAANLKIDTGTMRVWLSRCGLRDNETMPVQVERLIDGCWKDITPERMSEISLDGKYAGMMVQTIFRRFVPNPFAHNT